MTRIYYEGGTIRKSCIYVLKFSELSLPLLIFIN